VLTAKSPRVTGVTERWCRGPPNRCGYEPNDGIVILGSQFYLKGLLGFLRPPEPNAGLMSDATATPMHFPSVTPMHAGGRSVARGPRVRIVVAALALFSAACSDSVAPTPPSTPIDGVMPAVTDARIRLVPAIENVGVRDRVAYDLGEIEKALQAGDVQKVRYHVRISGGILIDYRAGLAGIVKDGPDVGGVVLALHAAAVAAGGTFDITALK
jgi:hypothetical protein